MPTTEHQETVCFSRLDFVDEPPRAEVTFEVPYQQIHLEVEPHKQRDYGLTAGSEGLGCEFFSEKTGELYSLSLDLNPYEDVDLTPPGVLEPLFERIASLSRPGRLRLTSFPTLPINADGIWISHDFSTALLSFGDLVIEPLAEALADVDAMQLVEVAHDVILGFERGQGALKLALAKNFDRHQNLFGVFVGEVTHGAEFMQQLQTVHRLYYGDPDLPEEAPNPLAELVVDDDGSPGADLLRRLVDFYSQDLEARKTTELLPR